MPGAARSTTTRSRRIRACQKLHHGRAGRCGNGAATELFGEHRRDHHAGLPATHQGDARFPPIGGCQLLHGRGGGHHLAKPLAILSETGQVSSALLNERLRPGADAIPMNEIATIVFPVFGLIGLGYVVAWSGLLGAQSGEALADFVFTIAIPLLIFRVVATADFSGGTPVMLWLAYYIGFVIAWILGAFLVRRLFGRDARAGLVAGISSAYGNTLLVGVPLAIAAYGAEGTAAIALLIAVHMPVLMTASAILIERALVVDGLSADADARVVAGSVVRNLATNPIVIALFAGNRSGGLPAFPYRGPPGDIINRLADTAATLALFSVGMSLRRYGISRNVPQSLVVAAIKLVVMPAIVFVCGRDRHSAAAGVGEGHRDRRRLSDRGELLSGRQSLRHRAGAGVKRHHADRPRWRWSP